MQFLSISSMVSSTSCTAFHGPRSVGPRSSWQVGRSLIRSLHPLMAFELQEVAECRAKEAKELHGEGRLWSIYLFTWLDVWSHLVVVTAAWFSTAYILVPYLAVHFAMAANRSGAPQAIMTPLTWLVPEGGSTLGTRGCYPWVYYSVSYALRVGCFMAFMKVDFSFKTGIARTDSSNCHDCEGLPFWLRRPWWSTEAICPVTPSSYHRCFEEAQWSEEGFCNTDAAMKGAIFNVGHNTRNLSIGVVFSPIFVVVLALLAWTCWALGRCLACCWGCLGCGKAVQVEESHHINPWCPMKSREPSKFSQAMVAKAIGLFCFDYLLDLNGIVAFVWTGNFHFAVYSCLVFSLSLAQQLATGGFGSFYQDARDSLAEGRLTDGLRRLTLTEKSLEAPLQLLIQYYSFLYASSSDYAVVSFAVSMLLSLYSVVDAAYSLMELNLLPSLQEVSASSDGVPLIQ